MFVLLSQESCVCVCVCVVSGYSGLYLVACYYANS